MSDSPAGAPVSKAPFWKNPFVLIGGGAVVLFVMLKSAGATSSTNATGASDTASQVDQQLSAQNAAVQQALAQQSSDVGTQLQANASALQDALNSANANDPNAGAISDLQAKVASISSQLAAQAQQGATTAAQPGAQVTQYLNLSPNSPLALQALSWSQSIGLPFAWGLDYIQHFGRLPNSLSEEMAWRYQIGSISTNGTWSLPGADGPKSTPQDAALAASYKGG
jgi:hypothetical protein